MDTVEGAAREAARWSPSCWSFGTRVDPRLPAAMRALVDKGVIVVIDLLPGGDLMASPKQLADLHAAGALTDEEFTAAKAKLLG